MISIEEFKQLLQAIEHNYFQNRVLDLRSRRINDYQMRCLSKAFEPNTTITTLLLDDNDFTEEGVYYLSKTLIHNTSIKHISLCRVPIGYNGLVFLSTVLSNLNHSLLTINLDSKKDESLFDKIIDYIGGETHPYDIIQQCLEYNRYLAQRSCFHNTLLRFSNSTVYVDLSMLSSKKLSDTTCQWLNEEQQTSCISQENGFQSTCQLSLV